MKDQKELYARATNNNTLFRLLAKRMTDEEIQKGINQCKYIMALYSKQSENYNHQFLSYNIVRKLNDTKDCITEEAEEIYLSQSYTVAYYQKEEVSIKYSYRLRIHNFILWRDKEPIQISPVSIKALQRALETEKEARENV